MRDPHRDLGNFRIRQNEKGNQMAKKNYRNKPDVFTATARHADPIADAIYHSLLPLDRIATEMEFKWGCERPDFVGSQGVGVSQGLACNGRRGHSERSQGAFS